MNNGKLTTTNAEGLIFYGINVCGKEEGESDIKPVYTSKELLFDVIKKYKCARFKAFSTYDDALKFFTNGSAYNLSNIASPEEKIMSTVVGEKPSQYRAPKNSVEFRKAIERGNDNFFDKCISENPRYLVSSGDTPAILQEGFRYNALHVACRSGHSSMISKVLSIVSDGKYFKRLYPDDSEDTTKRRTNYLVDMYLNTPDKGLNETPLHFACKFGHVKCVEILTSYQACDKLKKNKFSQLPVEVVCSRLKVEDNVIKEKILELLGDHFYIPLFRDEDHCDIPIIGKPWSPSLEISFSPVNENFTASSSAYSPLHNSSLSPSFRVSAYAGPLSPAKAEQFHRKWKSRCTSSPIRSSSTSSPFRLADDEKGLETIGRSLAQEMHACWNEFWQFLNDFADFSTEEGLTKLEDYLRKKYLQIINEDKDEESSVLETKSPPYQNDLNDRISKDALTDDSLNLCSSNDSRCSLHSLCRQLEGLMLNASFSPIAEVKKTQPVTRVRGDDDSPRKKHCINGFLNEGDQELGFILQSCRMSSEKLYYYLFDMATSYLQFYPVQNGPLSKNLKSKLKSEVVSLRKVVNSLSCIHNNDLSFVHPFFAMLSVESLSENVAPSDLISLVEIFKTFFLNSACDSSSDDECRSNFFLAVSDIDKSVNLQHYNCLISCIFQALLSLCNNNCNKVDIFNSIGKCACIWSECQYDNENICTEWSTKFVNNVLCNSLNLEGVNKEMIVKKLSFDEDDEKVFGGLDVRDFSMIVGENMDTTVTDVLSEDDDKESFVTALSSEEEYSNVNEYTEIYIYGKDASKLDADVLATLDGVCIDGNKFPYTSMWYNYITSYSDREIKQWKSPFFKNLSQKRKRYLLED